MTFPAPHTIGHRVWSTAGTDSHNQPVDAWAAPVDVAVYGWSAPQSEEVDTTRVVVDLKVYAPPTFAPSFRDRIVIPTGPNAGTFEVVGEVEDYNHGPFGWNPGNVVNLRRVEG